MLVPCVEGADGLALAVQAGALKQPISRTQDVSLSDDSACDMVYGCRDDLAVVRVRDPFGSLSRSRLVEVLTRCARTDMAVEVDEASILKHLGDWAKDRKTGRGS